MENNLKVDDPVPAGLGRNVPTNLEQVNFLGGVIRELSGLLEQTIGLQDAEGFISTVGNNLGNQFSAEYARDADSHDPERLAGILVDLKARINGTFEVVSAGPTQIVLSASRCPFGENVKDRPSLCMMTSNVFGRIVADRNGYAHVKIDQAIARGDAGCKVIVSLNLDEDSPTNGLEYFRE